MISVIIPCYNSAAYIGEHVVQLSTFLKALGESFEIVVVDDGSSDETVSILKKCAEQDSQIRVVAFPANRGKGAAVKAGMLQARGDSVLFTDADLPYDLMGIPAFLEALRSGSAVVLGARVDVGTVRGQRIHRTHLSHVFAWLANSVLKEYVPDTQAGFKGFTREAVSEIFPNVTTKGFAFDVDVIALAQARGLQITSVPVTLVNQAPSTVHVSRDGLRMCIDLARLFIKYRLGL